MIVVAVVGLEYHAIPLLLFYTGTASTEHVPSPSIRRRLTRRRVPRQGRIVLLR